MPSADVFAIIPRVGHLGHIVRNKARWRVSVAALNHRLHKLGIISDWKYRDFCIEIATRRYNREEPNPIERQKSVAWQKVLTSLWCERTTQADIARALSIPESEVNGLIFGMVAALGERPKGIQPTAVNSK